MSKELEFIQTILSNEPLAITSSWGLRIHPITGLLQFHLGNDLVNRNRTRFQIFSPEDGVIHYNFGSIPGKGLKLVAGDMEYYFSHNSQIFVGDEEQVKKGQLLSLSGSTGSAKGIHLHYETQYKNIPINSYQYLLPEEPMKSEAFEILRFGDELVSVTTGDNTTKIYYSVKKDTDKKWPEYKELDGETKYDVIDFKLDRNKPMLSVRGLSSKPFSRYYLGNWEWTPWI